MVRRTTRKLDAGLILLLTPILWGATFPGTKIALRRLPVVPFMAWSRLLGLAAIVALLPLLRKGDTEPRRRGREVLVPGMILGALMFLVVTIPMARFVDWLIGRQQRRTQRGGAPGPGPSVAGPPSAPTTATA